MCERSFHVQRLVCALAFAVLTAVFSHGQSIPDAPAPANVLITHMEAQRNVAPVAVKPATRVVDAKFITVSALVMGLTIADLERTQHCLGRGTCVEMNPMLPHSRSGMYAVNIPVNAATMYLAYRLKSAGRRTWWIAPAIAIAGHAVGASARF